MSLQFALAPLGGGFLKQRDRLGWGGQGKGRWRDQGGGERETETHRLNARPHAPRAGATPSRYGPLRPRELGGARGVRKGGELQLQRQKVSVVSSTGGPASTALPGGRGHPSPSPQDEWGQLCTYWLAPARDSRLGSRDEFHLARQAGRRRSRETQEAHSQAGRWPGSGLRGQGGTGGQEWA